MAKVIQTRGKRKSAVARATAHEGTGLVTINRIALDMVQPKLSRMKIQEPLMLAGETASKVDISVDVFGGGSMSQANAARLAIAKALVAYNKKLTETFLAYDRQLLVADVRLKETHKPNRHGKARSKTQKSYR